jgi:hypothetical protein
MSWFNRIGDIAKGVVNFTGIPGLIHDIATSGSNDDPWYVDAVNVAKGVVKVGTTPVRGAVKGLFAVGEASYELGGKARESIVEKGLELPFMYNRYKNVGETYEQYQQRVAENKDEISMGQVALSLFGPGKNAAENSGWFHDFTDRNLKFLSAGFDLFNPEDREAAFNDQFIGKFASGSVDFTSSMTIDPLFFAGFAGKGLSIASRAPMAAGLMGAGRTGIAAIPGSATRKVFGKLAMTTEGVDDLLGRALKGEGRAVEDVQFLARSDAKTQYEYWAKKRVTHPDAMAYLFGRATTEQEVVDTFRAVIGTDKKAMAAIAKVDDEAALVLDNLTDTPKPFREALNGQLDGDLIVNPEYNRAVTTYLDNLVKEDDRFRIALEKVSTGGNEFRGGTFARGPLSGYARNRAEKLAKTFADPEITMIQKTSLHPAVMVVNYMKGKSEFFTKFRPSGVFRVNDGDSYVEMNAFLREAVELSGGTFAAKAGTYADQYLAAATEGERLNIIKLAEKDALGIIAPNMTQQQIEKLYAIFDYRRAKTLKEHKDRGFLSIFTENGPVIAKFPQLERESANIVIAMDLRRLKDGIDSYERVLPGILSGIDPTEIAVRGQKFMNTLDNVNDIFKTSVLMRLGYTVRNLTEAQLSMMAKAFALPAAVAVGGPSAVQRFLQNRKAGFTRLIDNVEVLAGRKDDINVLRDEVAKLQDMLRGLDLSRKGLAGEIRTRMADIERGGERLIANYIAAEKAKGNLVGVEEAAAIVLPRELKRLRSALAEAEAVTLYHGSVADSFEFDPARPLSASTNAQIADRYATQEFAFGLERYISDTGRPVPLRVVTRKGPQRHPQSTFTAGYRGAHTAPDREFGASLDNITRIYPEDVYSSDAARIYGVGGKDFVKLDKQIVEFINQYKGSPNRMVTVYRAVPKDAPAVINPGDWVTPLREYADLHGSRYLDPEYRVEEMRVRAGDIFTDGNSWFEWGYDPRPVRKPYPEKLITAAARMKSDMIGATRAGNIVELRKGTSKGFVKVDEDRIRSLNPKELERAVFRVRRDGGSVTPMRVYGDALYLTKWSDIPLDVRKEVFGGDVKVWRAWVKSKGWQDQNSPLYNYLRQNNFGRAVVGDDRRAGGLSHIVLPEAVGEAGRGREVTKLTRAQIEAAQAEADAALDIAQPLQTTKERRVARTQVRRKEKSRRTRPAVSPYYDDENLIAMINNGVEDAAANLGRSYAEVNAQLDDMMARLGARISQSEQMAVKSKVGYGTFTHEANGQSYEVDEVFNNASWMLARTSSEQTWGSIIGSQQMAFLAGPGSRAMRPVKPGDPRYFEAWAGVLNLHFRDPETGVMDPIVSRILDGATNDEILGFLTRTRSGRIYANNTYTIPGKGLGFGKLKAGEENDYLLTRISDTRNAVKLYVPDEDTALMLRAAKEDGKPLTGGDVEVFLLNRFGANPENLPEINGLLVTTSKEYRDQERIVDMVNRRVMRFLGSLPEDTFARHPLVNVVYRENVRRNIDGIAQARGTDRLTGDEIARAERAAREEARREVERTLFTIVRRTGASSSQVMRLLFPFYAAYENTLMRWGGIIAENPQVVTTAARTIAQIVNGQLIVDQEGNRITDTKQLGEGGMANLVVQVPDAFIKALPGEWQDVAENAFKRVNIPLSSLDVITQGQAGNPGFGPYAVFPAYLILRQRPEFEEAFAPLFPAGMPNSASEIFLPSTVRRLKTMWSKDEMYVRTFNQMLRYETYNYNTGKRQDVPTVDEITSKVNKFYMLRSLTAISAPFAISPEVDFYQQVFRQFQNQYTEPGEAEAKFFEMYPDFFEATVSLSKNPGSLEANLDTVRNLRKFSGLMATAEAKGEPELMGWLANDFDGKYDFSQAAYQWQYRTGSYPGSANTYRQNRNPAELIKDANLKRGWTEYRKIQDVIDAFKIQNGIGSNRDPLLEQYNNAKRQWLDYMAQNNPDWYAAYMSPDRGKYMKRADVLEQAFQNKAWMAQNGDRAVVKAVALYLDARKKIGQALLQRDQMGGSRSLDANSNDDLAELWDKFVTQLGAESPEFSDFYNRYFPNDPVVI